MIDLAFLLAFIALPLATFLITRSLTWTVIGLAFGFGVAGNALQSAISLGMSWNVRGLQALSVVTMAIVLMVGVIWHRGSGSLRRQVLAIVVPAVVLGAFLIAMRFFAPGSPGPLSAVGYLVNHPQAEDNAKWLHLAAQLADGRIIEFSGYAGGPLLLLMSMMAALISVLSTVMLGGVNEVAVAANTVVGTQFLLIALVPFALAPFAERRVDLRGLRRWAPVPAVWAAITVIFLASSVVTSFGHLSLQFVLIVLALWSSVFILRTPGRAKLLTTLVIATTASVWLPFNVLGLLLLVACLAWVVARRDLLGLGAWVVVVASVWDAIFSSTAYLLGFGSETSTEGAVQSSGASAEGAAQSVQSTVSQQVETARSLFTAPGGVEQIQPLVGGLALASVLFCVWLVARNGASGIRGLTPFAPLVVLSLYLVIITVGDAIATGGAPHYGGHKLAFAITIAALASTLPIAIAGLDRSAGGMTPVRWAAIGAVILLFTLDTMLPRAISALSPALWPAVDSSSPAYWSAAEVKPQASQPLSSLPVACLFAPPEASSPTALPLGQESYGCTRLLVGLNGLEGSATALTTWLQADWLSQRSQWPGLREALATATEAIRGRSVILMNPAGGIAGVATWDAILQQR